MSSIGAVSSAMAPQLAAQANPKSSKPDGDGDHGVEPPTQQAAQAAPGKPGGVNLTA